MKKLLSLALVFTMVLTCASFFNGVTVSADTAEDIIITHFDGTLATTSEGSASEDTIKSGKSFYPVGKQTFSYNYILSTGAAGTGTDANYVKSIEEDDGNKCYEITWGAIRKAKQDHNFANDVTATNPILSISARVKIPDDENFAVKRVFNLQQMGATYANAGTYGLSLNMTYENGVFTPNYGSKFTAKMTKTTKAYTAGEWATIEFRFRFSGTKLEVEMYVDDTLLAKCESNSITTAMYLGNQDISHGATGKHTDGTYTTYWDDIMIKAIAEPDTGEGEGGEKTSNYTITDNKNGSFTAAPASGSVTGTLVVAVFNSDNTVKKIYHASGTDVASITVSDVETGTFKAFLFETLESAVPMCPMIEGTN